MSLLDYKWNLLLFVVALILFVIGHFFAPIALAFAAGTFSVALLFALYHYITANILGKTDDKKEIVTEKNVAYAIYQAGIMLLIAIAYMSAFAVFLTLKQ